MQYDHLLIPAPEADPSAEPLELTAPGALAELRDALAGWIDDALETLDSYVHDSDRDNARQIMASLFNAADQFKYAHTVEDRLDADLVRRFHRAGRQLTFAAEQLQSGFLIAAHLGQVPTVDTTGVHVDDQSPAIVTTFYAAAVAYVRQASGMLFNGSRIVSARATVTRCAGGSFARACSHGREEDHVIPADGRCEASALLAEDDSPCNGAVDEVLIRDGNTGPRYGDDTDQRGVRACGNHGVAYLRTLDVSTRLVYPGPGDTPDGQCAVAVFKMAGVQDALHSAIAGRVG